MKEKTRRGRDKSWGSAVAYSPRRDENKQAEITQTGGADARNQQGPRHILSENNTNAAICTVPGGYYQPSRTINAFVLKCHQCMTKATSKLPSSFRKLRRLLMAGGSACPLSPHPLSRGGGGGDLLWSTIQP